MKSNDLAISIAMARGVGDAADRAEAAAAHVDEVAATIPEDFTELEADVGNLKSAISVLDGKMATAGDKQLLNPDTATVENVRVAASTGNIIADNNYRSIIIPVSVEAGCQYRAKYIGNTSTFDDFKLYSFNSVDIGDHYVDATNSYGPSYSRLVATSSASYFLLYFHLTSGTVADAVSKIVICKSSVYPDEYTPYYLPVGTVVDNVREKMIVNGDKQLLDFETAIIKNTRVSSQGKLLTDANYIMAFVPYNVQIGDKFAACIFVEANNVQDVRLYTFNSIDIGDEYVDYPVVVADGKCKLTATGTAAYLGCCFALKSGATETLESALSKMVICKSADYPEAFIPFYSTLENVVDAARENILANPTFTTVGTDGDYYIYTDVNAALTAHPSLPVSVDFGTYETEVSGLATDKSIIGADREMCVLTGTDKDYDTPPIEIAGGVIKNFTVIMVNDEEAAHTGYCLHSDNAACASNSLIIENCKFVCTGAHAVGMGIYPSETVIYRNCEFVTSNDEAMTNLVPIYAHNAGASDGMAVLRFHNCIFRGEGYALKLQSWASGCSMSFEFINCTCESDTMTGDDMVWTDYVSGDVHDETKLHVFTGKMTLLGTSHGNNLDILNAE